VTSLDVSEGGLGLCTLGNEKVCRYRYGTRCVYMITEKIASVYWRRDDLGVI
jgi:hypothetical protein